MRAFVDGFTYAIRFAIFLCLLPFMALAYIPIGIAHLWRETR